MRRALRDFCRKTPRCRHRGGLLCRPRHRGRRHQLSASRRRQLERDIDAYDEAVSLDRVLQVIEPAKKLRLVILDACRDNPFARTMKRTVATRALGRGLAGSSRGSRTR